MPFDRTLKKIEALERQKIRLEIPFAEADARIAELKALGPKWVARWQLPNGDERTRPAKSESDAKKIETLERNKIKMGETSDPGKLRTTFHEVLDYYLEHKMAGKSSFQNARAHVNHCKAIMDSRLTLEKIDKDPRKILKAYFDSLPKLNPKSFGKKKSVWNHKVTLCAAMNYFIRMERLRILNPFEVMEMPMPKSRRESIIEPEDYQALLRVSEKPKYPAWLRVLFTEGWECGLRMGEYLSWRWEWATLDQVGDDLPWLKTLLEKQHGEDPEWREIPLSYEAAESLKSIRGQKETGPIFYPERTTVYKYVRWAFAEAGLTHLTFHDFRRAYKRRHLHLDKSLRMEMQGHKTEAMDSHYLILKRKEMEKAVRSSYGPSKSSPGFLPGLE